MDAQTALWALPSRLDDIWWLVCAAFALPSAMMILVKMVINEPINLLTTSRVVIAGSLFFFGMVPLNSGFIPWGVLLACVGGFMTTTLIATGWCHREDQSLTVSRAIWNWLRCKARKMRQNNSYTLHKGGAD